MGFSLVMDRLTLSMALMRLREHPADAEYLGYLIEFQQRAVHDFASFSNR